MKDEGRNGRGKGMGSVVLDGVVTRIDNRGHAWEVTAATSAREEVVWMTQAPPRAGAEVRITIEVAS